MIPSAAAARRVAPLAFLTLGLALLPDLALAQVGGGGAGVINQIVQWFMQNVARGLVMLGIIVIAVFMFIQRFSAGAIAAVVGGGLLLANAEAIAGFFGF